MSSKFNHGKEEHWASFDVEGKIWTMLNAEEYLEYETHVAKRLKGFL